MAETIDKEGRKLVKATLNVEETSKGKKVISVKVQDLTELKEIMEKTLYILARIEKRLNDTVDEEIEQKDIEKELKNLKVDITD